MSDLIYRYQLDPDGDKLDNLVKGEVHKLSSLRFRAIAPKYGLFFVDSLVVRDVDANRVLAKTEYRILDLNSDATLRFGKPIAATVLITNPSVSENTAIDYQVLGGPYTDSIDAVGRMWETWLNDNRPVDWVNVFNKPHEYPPALHNHLLRDVWGFEPVVISLERIADALLLRDIPAFEAVVNYVNNVKVPEVSEDDVLSLNRTSEGVVTMRRLALAMQHLNFNAIQVSPNTAFVRNGARMDFRLTTTAYPDNEQLFWRVLHLTTTGDDFAVTAGSMLVYGNEAKFTVQLGLDADRASENQEKFRLEICRESAMGPVLYTTGIFTIAERTVNPFMLADLTCCYREPRIRRNVINSYTLGR